MTRNWSYNRLQVGQSYEIHAYVLMTNHLHLLVTPCKPLAIAKLMQSVGRHYARYVNDHYRRSWSLWEGHYKASLVDCERYVLRCYPYIELKPVRAGTAGVEWARCAQVHGRSAPSQPHNQR